MALAQVGPDKDFSSECFNIMDWYLLSTQKQRGSRGFGQLGRAGGLGWERGNVYKGKARELGVKIPRQMS